MKSTLNLGIVVLVCSLIPTPVLRAQETSRVIFFGNLVTTLPPSTPGQAVTLQLWDAAGGGNSLYCENQMLDVDTNQTISFSFGAGTPPAPPCPSLPPGLDPTNFPSGSSRFLDVVNTGSGVSVLAARLPLSATPFALSPGPTGPAGPAGAAGPAGPPGAAGPPGPVNSVTAGDASVAIGGTPSAPTVAVAPRGITAPNIAAPLSLAANSAESTIFGFNRLNGPGVRGDSISGYGLYGRTTGVGFNIAGVYGEAIATTTNNVVGVFGTAGGGPNGTGVVGLGSATGGFFQATGSSGTSVGVFGTGSTGVKGVAGAATGTGVDGRSTGGNGVFGRSETTWGVRGDSGSSDGVAGFAGGNGNGVLGRSDSALAFGVFGFSASGIGVGGRSNGDGNHAAVSGFAGGTNGKGVNGVADIGPQAVAIYGRSAQGFAGVFDGQVLVNGTTATKVLQITGGADLSERFEVRGANHVAGHAASEAIEPGMVVVIDPQNAGKLSISSKAYDRRAAGVISGAGGIKTGMLMGQSGSLADGDYPIALAGRVYCWADASRGPIELGDLLTTSDTPGHAMKVTDQSKAQSAIIGKALTALETGKGLVLILVTLR